MSQPPRASDDMTDRELAVDTWEIAAGVEAAVRELRGEVAELRGKVTELETEFGPVARRYRKLVPALGRAASNGRHHGD